MAPTWIDAEAVQDVGRKGPDVAAGMFVHEGLRGQHARMQFEAVIYVLRRYGGIVNAGLFLLPKISCNANRGVNLQ